MNATIRYVLSHEGGATDELYTVTYPEMPVPRVGEYVTVGSVVHGYVFGVDHDLGVEGEIRRVTVALACDGTYDRCDWDCTRDHARKWRKKQVGLWTGEE